MFTPSRIAAFGVTHVHLINDDLALDHWVCLNIRGKTGEKHAFHWKKCIRKQLLEISGVSASSPELH